jgi:hypothetical protein
VNPAKHDPPRYVEEFALQQSYDGPHPGHPVVVARDDDPSAGHDVVDELGESIGFFAVRDGSVVLNAPHGLDASGSVQEGQLVLRQGGRDVLRAEIHGSVIVVRVVDRRLDSRLAAGLVATVFTVRNS